MQQVYNKYSGFTKNTKSFVTNFGNRIPDFINAKTLGEIKNVSYQYLSRQIRGFLELAKKMDKTFVLVVTEGTKLSKPLVRAIQEAGGRIIEIGDKVGKGTKTVPIFFKNVIEEQLNFGLGDGRC